jgi:predicted transposase YdaD
MISTVRFEEARKMKYITTAERIGMEKGKKEGLEQGRKEGKLIGEILFAQRMLKLTIYSEEELEQKSFEDLKTILENFEAKLADREGAHVRPCGGKCS